MKHIFTVLMLSIFAIGQVTLSPPRAQYGKKAKGEFTLTNESFQPLSISLEAMSAAVKDGDFTVSPMGSDQHLKLSEYSAKIGAKQTHTFAYDLRCNTLPCAAVIFSSVAVGHTDNGMGINGRVGHVIYVCQKEKNCREEFLKSLKEK